MSRIWGIVAGVFMVITGAYALLTPLETYGVIGWVITCALIADGVTKILLWNDYRKMGVSDVWALVGGIASVLLGVALAADLATRVAVDVFVAYVVSWWILLGGCVRIVRSFRMRRVRQTLGTILGANWGLALVVGILMVVLGIFCLANPIIVMFTIGWQIGFAMIAGGIGLISATA